MIDVCVGAVNRHPETGVPQVSLDPTAGTNCRRRLILPISSAAACTLTHELQGHITLRAAVYTLMGQVADALGGEIVAVEIVPAMFGMAAGRLVVSGVAGEARLPVEIVLGIGLAVVLGLPLRASEALLFDAADRLPAPEQPSADASTPALPRADVPDAFKRAFQG
ncbi:MAG: hypothetical protein IT306_30805 [Chloroflexi bacterium]|nr:hypothetical protein [Chloroflexota bacterium]